MLFDIDKVKYPFRQKPLRGTLGHKPIRIGPKNLDKYGNYHNENWQVHTSATKSPKIASIAKIWLPVYFSQIIA